MTDFCLSCSTLRYAPEFAAQDDGFVLARGSDPADLPVLENDHGAGYLNREGLEVVAVSKPEHGSIGIASDGRTVQYAPDDGFTGVDSFSYTVENEAGEVTEASVFVNVVEPLFALSDTFAVAVGSQANSLDVLANDSFNVSSFHADRPSEFLVRIVGVDGAGSSAAVTISEDGQEIVYSPVPGFRGTESFRYVVEDESGNRAEAMVTVEVGADGSTISPAQVKQRLIELALDRSASQFGQFASPHPHHFYDEDSWTTFPIQLVQIAQDTSAVNLSANDDFSQTNNQVNGVDEGDVVKTDGDYLYVLSDWFDEASGEFEHQLIIVSIADPSKPTVTSRYEFESDVVELYLHGDRVTVISQAESELAVTLLDVSDRTTPQLINESTMDGWLEASRSVGDFVYVIANAYQLSQLPAPNLVCSAGDEQCFFETREEFVARVSDSILDTLPHVESRDAGGEIIGSSSLLDSAQLLDVTNQQWEQFTAIVSFQITTEMAGFVSSTAFAHGTIQDVYVSDDAIYLFEESSLSTDGWWFGNAATTIHKVSLGGDGSTAREASGKVPGHLLNRFSADEHDGYLRIATTSSPWGGENHLFVLGQSGNELEVVGSVEGLAPGERIYSARFEGARGFVVTFRKVDPLFAIDLSDPTNPQVLGELKISGYSNYLQLMDENHLLGIGREANGGGLFQELQVSVFDVSDFSNPTLLHRYSFEGGRQLWSPIMADAWNLGTHHAASYFASRQTLVLPVYEGDQPGWSWNQAGQMEDVAMRVLHIDLEQGIESLGDVQFDSAFDPHLARSVRVGDILYSISPDMIKANELSQPENQLGEVFIGAGATDDRLVLRGETSVSIDVLANDMIGLEEASRQIVAVRQPVRGGSVQVSDDDELIFEPDPDFYGPVSFSYTLGVDDQFRDVGTVTVDVVPSWNNGLDSHDVNRDGLRSALDALDLVNFFNDRGTGGVDELESQMLQEAAGNESSESDLGKLRPDIDNDGFVSALDLLMLVNYLNSVVSPSEAAAEAEGPTLLSRSSTMPLQDEEPELVSGEEELRFVGPEPFETELVETEPVERPWLNVSASESEQELEELSTEPVLEGLDPC